MRSGLDSVPGRWADDAVARVVELVREHSLQATGPCRDVNNAVGDMNGRTVKPYFGMLEWMLD